MYRSCGSLISFMFTPHPSYIPLQAMCCGSIPIARHRFTAWALKDGHNCLLVDPLPHQILEAYARLRSDADLRRHLYENALHTFNGVTWPDQLQRAYRWFTAGTRRTRLRKPPNCSKRGSCYSTATGSGRSTGTRSLCAGKAGPSPSLWSR